MIEGIGRETAFGEAKSEDSASGESTADFTGRRARCQPQAGKFRVRETSVPGINFAPLDVRAELFQEGGV